MAALVELAADYNVVVPLHPRTLRALRGSDWLHRAGRLRLLEPVGYLDMTMLERHAGLIITDSGGVQKEAFFHRVPCVTLRDETEWIELVGSAGTDWRPRRRRKACSRRYASLSLRPSARKATHTEAATPPRRSPRILQSGHPDEAATSRGGDCPFFGVTAVGISSSPWGGCGLRM